MASQQELHELKACVAYMYHASNATPRRRIRKYSLPSPTSRAAKPRRGTTPTTPTTPSRKRISKPPRTPLRKIKRSRTMTETIAEAQQLLNGKTAAGCSPNRVLRRTRGASRSSASTISPTPTPTPAPTARKGIPTTASSTKPVASSSAGFPGHPPHLPDVQPSLPETASSSSSSSSAASQVLSGSGLVGLGRVLSVRGELYDVSLALQDTAKNQDKFFRLQLVELTPIGPGMAAGQPPTLPAHLRGVFLGDGVVLVTNWGRVGTPGQTMVKGPWSQERAIQEMRAKFKSKTGLDFANRHDGQFSPARPGLYNIFEMQQRADETTGQFAARRNYSSVGFCIDRSGSMGMTVGGTFTRHSVVCAHLIELLESSDPGLMFTVILFDTVVTAWRNGALVANTSENRDRLRKFLKSNGPRGGTRLLAGIATLAGLANVQERFLLADGDAGTQFHQVIAQARATPINCVGVGLPVGSPGHHLLTSVALAGGGSATFLMDKDLHQRARA